LKAQADLQEVPVASENVPDLQLSSHDDGRQVGKGNVGLVPKSEPQVEGYKN
jgi:hypothetical protein